MTATSLLQSIDHGVLTLTLNRPEKLNAIDTRAGTLSNSTVCVPWSCIAGTANHGLPESRKPSQRPRDWTSLQTTNTPTTSSTIGFSRRCGGGANWSATCRRPIPSTLYAKSKTDNLTGAVLKEIRRALED